MRRVLHLSDPHFGTEQLPVVDALLALIHLLRPDAVLIGGDVTQRARRRQFQHAAEFVRRLGCPSVCIPGNHDIPLYNVFARLFHPYGQYRRWMGENLEPVWQNPFFMAIGVNTTHPRRHINGEISDAQIERVTRQLASATPSQVRIVMAHHPVRAAEPSDRANLLIGRERAVPAWLDAGADVILGGHIHLPYQLPVQGNLPNQRQGWVVQAGTAVSHRVRGNVPNSVNIIARSEHNDTCEACFAERWDFDSRQQRFELVNKRTLALAR